MLQLFAEKAEKCNRQIEVLTSGNLRQRVAAYLLENCNPDYRVRLHMNREDLAVYLNTTRPSLSRMLLTLQDEGIIRLVGRKVIEITDYERLQSEIERLALLDPVLVQFADFTGLGIAELTRSKKGKSLIDNQNIQ